MKTAMEVADGFPRGQHRVRAQNMVLRAHDEGMLTAADEIEKLIITHHEDPGMAVTAVRAWVRAVREIAEKEEE
jgi:hypothetical protein